MTFHRTPRSHYHATQERDEDIRMRNIRPSTSHPLQRQVCRSGPSLDLSTTLWKDHTRMEQQPIHNNSAPGRPRCWISSLKSAKPHELESTHQMVPHIAFATRQISTGALLLQRRLCRFLQFFRSSSYDDYAVPKFEVATACLRLIDKETVYSLLHR